MSDLKTDAARLAEQYVNLGGKRRAKLDDNLVETRKWEDDAENAANFWRDNIKPLPEKERREVETNLPPMNFD